MTETTISNEEEDEGNFFTKERNRIAVKHCLPEWQLSSKNDENLIRKIDVYKLHKIVGVGGCALVIDATNEETGEKRVFKSFDKKEFNANGRHVATLKEIIHEVEMMKICGAADHPNIVKLYDVLQTPNEVHLVLDSCPRGDLFKLCYTKGRIQEKEVKRITKQMIAALSQCHEKGVVHRDVKPANFLIDADNNIKLCDFGIAHKMVENEIFLTSQYLSLPYCAPEMLRGRQYTGFGVDVWMLGVCVYFLLTAKLPFLHINEAELFNLIESGKYEDDKYLSPAASDFLKTLLVVDVAARATLPKLQKHSWLKDDDAFTRSKQQGTIYI